MRLVVQVHQELIKFINKGDLAVDATVGNGHDALFLAQCGALVMGFDIQGIAIQNTKNLLEKVGYLDQVTLFQCGHEAMLENIPKDWIGKVRVVMFNLGYLPGGDKVIITRSETTLQALDAAYYLLVDGGYLSLVLYPDHPGGGAEADVVRNWISNLDLTINHIHPTSRGPEWYLIQKAKVRLLHTC